MALRTMLQHAAKSCTTSVPALAATGVRALSTKFVNHIELLGRVGKDPQRIGANDAITFPFYTESVVKMKDGTAKTYPCWHKVIVVKKAMAEVVTTNVERGQRCYISGRVAYRAPETSADGRLIYNHQAAIVAENIVFLEKSRKVRTEDSDSGVIEAQKESVAAN